MDKILKYTTNWIQYVDRNQTERLSKLLKVTNMWIKNPRSAFKRPSDK
jgi:hypothetical protein